MRGRGSGFRDVLAIREFRALWAAELFSLLGDQLARVALALLVFSQTSSAALSALTYALTFVPAVLGGFLLSGLADRYPRRQVLVATDLLRAGLAAAMAIPTLPLPVLWVLVGVLSMSAAPFKAAQAALLPQILYGDRYVVGLSLRQVTTQGAQLVGYASGGLLLVVVEPHVALAGNAATFLVSAALIVTGVRPRPASVACVEANDPDRHVPVNGDRQLLPVVALVCLVGLFVVPAGVAAPYGAVLGVGAVGVGLLLAADPLGSVIGAWLLSRSGIRGSPRAVVALAACAGIPLIGCLMAPGLAVSIALIAASGALSTAYLILTQAIVVNLVPDHRRGRVMGRIAAGLYSAQGIAISLGGLAAEVGGPFRAVAGAGLLGTMLALCVGIWWRRVARPRHDLAAGSEHVLVGERRVHHSFSTSDTSSQTNIRNTDHTAHHSFSTSDTSSQANSRNTDHTAHHSFSTTTPPSRRAAGTMPGPDDGRTGTNWPQNRRCEDPSAPIMGVSTRDNRWSTGSGRTTG